MHERLEATDIIVWISVKRSSVFDHCDVPSDISGSFKVKCEHVTTEIKGSSKATTNHLNHIKVRIQCLFTLATLGPGYFMTPD